MITSVDFLRLETTTFMLRATLDSFTLLCCINKFILDDPNISVELIIKANQFDQIKWSS